MLAEGTYVADGTILVPNDTTLEGYGPGTVIEMADIDTTDNLIENSDTSTGTGVVIKNLKLDGREDLNTAGNQRGIYLNNIGDISASRVGATVQNTVIQHFRSDGIYVTASDQTTITSNYLDNNDRGIYTISTSTHVTVANNITVNNTVGMLISSSASTVSGNVARNNTNGIYISSADNTSITGNTSTNNLRGIYLELTTNSSVTGNTVDTNSTYGIYATFNANNNIISGNTVQDSGGGTANNGIYVDNSDKNSITGNNITDVSCSTTCYAINVSNSTSDNTYISNNSFSGAATINDAGTGTRITMQFNSGIDQSSSDLVLQAPDEVQVVAQANSDATFVVRNASNQEYLTVDTESTTDVLKVAIGAGSDDVVLTLDSFNSDPTGTIPDGSMFYDADDDVFRCRVNGSWVNCDTTGGGGGGSQVLAFLPEFAGGTFDPDGSNNQGTLVAGVVTGLSSGQGYKHNYYDWSTTQGSAQDYDVVVQVQIPTDYQSMGAASTFKFWHNDPDGATTTAQTTWSVYDVDETQCFSSAFNGASAGNWEQETASSLGSCSFSAGDIITFRFKLATTSGAGNLQLGEFEFGYSN